MQVYSNPERESDPYALPDIEVFQLTAHEVAELDDELVGEYMRKREHQLAGMNSKARGAMLNAIVENEGITGGWFWWSCFPGCMPDGPPTGPFETAKDAIIDAQST